MLIRVTGQVQFTINIDPTVWIFDKRKFPLEDRIPGATGSAMELEPFLMNAEPLPCVTHVLCHREGKETVRLTWEQTRTSYLCFALDGEPIREGGPALLYLADGGNKEQPIDFLRQLELICE